MVLLLRLQQSQFSVFHRGTFVLTKTNYMLIMLKCLQQQNLTYFPRTGYRVNFFKAEIHSFEVYCIIRQSHIIKKMHSPAWYTRWNVVHEVNGLWRFQVQFSKKKLKAENWICNELQKLIPWLLKNQTLKCF